MIKNNLLKVFLLALSVIPSMASADSTLNPVSTVLYNCTQSSTPCGYNELIALVNAGIQYGIELMGIALVLVLLYVGFQYLTSGGDVGKVKKSKDMLNKVMWGMIYTLCAWVIVYFILQSLGVDPSFYNKIISV